MKKLTIILSIALLSVISAKATLCKALSSSTWENSATWSCGQVPAPPDSVFIPAGITVTVTAVETYVGSPMVVTVAGTLYFQTGKKLELPCGSVFQALAGGLVAQGNGGGNSNLISICSVEYWAADSGNAPGPFCWGCSALPVVLKSFNTTCNGNDVTLNWSTASEINNNYFTVERSGDGLMWTEKAMINGAGTTPVVQYYTWNDAEPLSGTSYYRLKQTDYDGHCNIMSILPSSCNSSQDVTIYPNPSYVSNNIYCQVNSASVQNITIRVTDCIGRCVSLTTANVGIGITTQKVMTGMLKPGTYILDIDFGNNSKPVKKPLIIKE